MDEAEDEAAERKVFKIDRVNVVTTLEIDQEWMTVYKAHINDAGMHFTGYGPTRAKAAIIALNKYAG